MAINGRSLKCIQADTSTLLLWIKRSTRDGASQNSLPRYSRDRSGRPLGMSCTPTVVAVASGRCGASGTGNVKDSVCPVPIRIVGR